MSAEKKCLIAGSIFCASFLLLYVFDGIRGSNQFAGLAFTLLVLGVVAIFVSFIGYCYEDHTKRIAKHLEMQGIKYIDCEKNISDNFGKVTVEYQDQLGTFDLKRIDGFWRVGQMSGQNFIDLTDIANPQFVTLGPNSPLRAQDLNTST